MNFISQIIGYPLGWIMWLAYHVCNNYAFSIIIFTLITKIILFPISIKQQKSTAAMTAMQPKLDKLKKQYANNQQKMQEAQMELYSEEGINPMASCLPMLIQLPILYGVFDVVYRPLTHILRISKDTVTKITEIVAQIEMYSANKNFALRPEIYIVQAIKSGDAPEIAKNFPEVYEQVMGFNNHLLGADLGNTPTFKPEVMNMAAIVLIAIPILSGVFQLIMSIYSQRRQKKTNPGMPSNAGMNAMFYIMPIFSVWIAFSYPAAIGFYWTTSSLFGLIQQIVLNKVFTPEYMQKLIEKDRLKRKNKKKQGVMERYQQLVKEQQATQNGGKVIPTTFNAENAGVAEDDENVTEVKLSKSKQKEYERMLIREARRKQAEKYGEEYVDDDEN